MEIGTNQLFEAADGSIEVAGIGGFIVIKPQEMQEWAIFLNKRPPRIRCVICGTPGNNFICKKHHTESIEKAAPQVTWVVFCNKKRVLSGKTSEMEAYTQYTKLAYKKGAKSWDRKNKRYYDDKGNIFTLEFKGKKV